MASESHYADVQVELTELTFRRLVPTVLVGGIGVVGSTGMLASHYDDLWLWHLTELMGLVCALRVGVVIAFSSRGRKPLSSEAAQVWGLFYAVVTMAYAGTMAASTLYNFRYHDHTAWTFCTLGTFMLCAAFSARLGASPAIMRFSGLMMLGALAFSVLRSEDRLARLGALLICAFAYVYVESVRSKFEAVVEQLRSRRMLRELAEQDGLTGLINRRHFQQCVGSACAEKITSAILYIDLDRFKAVNDTYGHRTGDLLLEQVAARLRSVVRSTDLLARLGGDEFAILHGPQATEVSAEALAGRINAVIAVPFLIDEEEISIGASIGIRLAVPEGEDPQRLLSLADKALYQVKQMGRGSFCFARD